SVANVFQATGDQGYGGVLVVDVARRTARAACLYARLEGSPRGDAPGSTGRPRRERGSAKARTRPHSAPMKLWTSEGAAVRLLCGLIVPSASGCQNVASSTVEPAAWTISG